MAIFHCYVSSPEGIIIDQFHSLQNGHFFRGKTTRPSRSSVRSGVSITWGEATARQLHRKYQFYVGKTIINHPPPKKKLFEKDHLSVSLFFLQCHVSSFQTLSAPCCYYHKFSNGKKTTDGDSSSLEKPTVRWCSLIFFVTLCDKESLKPGEISPASRTSRTGHWHYSSNSNSNEPTTWWRQGRWQRVNHTASCALSNVRHIPHLCLTVAIAWFNPLIPAWPCTYLRLGLAFVFQAWQACSLSWNLRTQKAGCNMFFRSKTTMPHIQ